MATPEERAVDPTTPETELRQLADTAYDKNERGANWNLWTLIMGNPQASLELMEELLGRLKTTSRTWLSSRDLLNAVDAIGSNPAIDLLLWTQPDFLRTTKDESFTRPTNLWVAVVNEIEFYDSNDSLLEQDINEMVKALAGTPFAKTVADIWKKNQVASATTGKVRLLRRTFREKLRTSVTGAVRRRNGDVAAEACSYITLFDRAQAPLLASTTIPQVDDEGHRRFVPIQPGIVKLAKRFSLWLPSRSVGPCGFGRGMLGPVYWGLGTIPWRRSSSSMARWRRSSSAKPGDPIRKGGCMANRA